MPECYSVGFEETNQYVNKSKYMQKLRNKHIMSCSLNDSTYYSYK